MIKENKSLKIFTKHRSLLILLSCLSFVSGAILLPYILADTPFMLGWDMSTQYSSFYEGLKGMIIDSVKNRSFPFYAWSSFLGNNYWGSKLFYAHDCFDYLSVLLLPHASYNTVIIIQTYIKLLISGLCFFIFSKNRKMSDKTAIIGAVLFTFSAYALEILKDPFFLSFYIFIPLYFFTIDQYLEKKKRMGYIFVTAFLVLTQYYLFYSLSLFTIIYFIYRYYEIKHTPKGVIKEALPLIGYYIVGVMMAGFAIVPEFFNILSNPRVGVSSAILFYKSIKTYFYGVLGLFIPSSMIINRTNDFVSLYTVVSDNNSVLYVCLWAGSLCSLLVPQLFIRKDTRRQNIILYSVFIALLLIPFGSSMMHGFSEPVFRWLELPLFMNLSLILPMIEDTNRIDVKILKKTLIAISIALALSSPLLGFLTNTPFVSYSKEYFLILTAIPFLICCTLILLKKVKYLLAFCLVECAFVSYHSVYGNSAYRQYSKEFLQGVTSVLLNRNDLNNYLLTLNENNKNEFYRVYVDPSSVYWEYSINLNLNFNVQGLMTFDSTVAASSAELNSLISMESYLPWSYNIQDPLLIDYLGTKYAIVTSEDQLPHSEFKRVGEFNYLLVYENLHYSNFAHGYIEINPVSKFRKENLLSTLYCHDENYDELSELFHSADVHCDSVNYGANQVYAKITASDKTILSSVIPYEPGWKVQVNNQDVRLYSINGGMLGFEVQAGNNNITMTFTPQGFKSGCILSLLGWGMMLFLAYKEKNKD